MTQLVLLSGWGIDARIWQPLAPHWPAGITISTPDWPGYGGRAPLAEPDDLAALASAMSHDLPENAVWVGWSLGGLLAASLLEHLSAPRALILLGTGTRFTTNDDAIDATSGVSSNELATFRRAFERDPEKTWRHFLRWQLAGEPDPRGARQHLEYLMATDDLPAERATLASGLQQLATLDIGSSLANPACPMLRIRGCNDSLLAPADGGEHAVIANAGHCPQLSAPGELAELISALVRHPTRCDDSLREVGDGR